MKINFFQIAFAIIFIISVSSCNDETFSPYGELQTSYSLNCIVCADTNLQITTLYKSYASNTNNNEENKKASFIHNASIRLWRGNDDIYILSENNNTDTNYYYTNNFMAQAGDSLEILAILPDGNRLKSKTKIPDFVKKDDNKLTEIVALNKGNEVVYAWQPNEENQVFVPTLYIYYKELINEVLITKKIVVPWKYVDNKGINIPPQKKSLIRYNLKNIEKVLKKMSEGKNKDNFLILALILELKIFDKNLSAYYLSVGRRSGNYSIRLDSQDFSNIEGGFGVFGSYITQKIAIVFDDDYLAQFGYGTKLEVK